MTGAAGEHLVMSRLLTRGYVAALAPQGAPNLDVVVTYQDGSRLCSLQVKTRWDKGADGGWHMSKKHESISHPRMYYAFVDLGKDTDDIATTYVVPSATVANVVAESHAQWLDSPGKNGHIRKDSNLRRFLPDYTKFFGAGNEFGPNWLNEYREAWHLLEEREA